MHLLAPTGTGKTYIACAIGIAACQAGYSVAYFRLDQLVDALAVLLPADKRYVDLVRRLQNVDVLILDDFLTIGINQRGQEDLTKIIFDRDGRLPTIVASQTSAAYWLEPLPIESAPTPSSAGSTAANASASATTTCANICLTPTTRPTNSY